MYKKRSDKPILLRRAAFAIVAACFFFCSGPAAAAPSAAITRAEWTAYLQQDAKLQDADSRLNATYRAIMNALDAEGKNTLLLQQRAWINERNTAAFARHAKGSPEYLKLLAEATLAREVALRAAHPAPVVTPPAQEDKPLVQPPSRVDEPAASPSPEPKSTPPAPAPDKVSPRVETTPGRPENDLVTNVAPQVTSPQATTKITRINTTSAKFGTDYNALARSFKAAQFPAKPSRVTGSAPQKTENYAITDNISILFNYIGNLEKPETITFQGQRFVSGTPRDRDEIAYALVTLLKTLDPDPNKTEADKNAEISGLLRGIKTAFTKDATRIWRNNGLMYVISYVKQADLFSMTVRVDSMKK